MGSVCLLMANHSLVIYPLNPTSTPEPSALPCTRLNFPSSRYPGCVSNFHRSFL